MRKRRISWLLAALAVPVLALGAMVSTASAEEGIDPKNAKNLIDIALVVDDSVLDGEGWTVIRDEFSETPIPSTAACNNSAAKLKTLDKNLSSGLAGRGNLVAVQDPEPGQFEMLVATEIWVYNTAAPLAAAFKDVKAVYAGNDLAACLVTQLEGQLSGATGAKVAPYFPGANDDPTAAAYSVEIKASQLVDPIRVEHYTFTMGNTRVEMTFIGPKPMLDKASVQFLIELQGEALKLVGNY